MNELFEPMMLHDHEALSSKWVSWLLDGFNGFGPKHKQPHINPLFLFVGEELATTYSSFLRVESRRYHSDEEIKEDEATNNHEYDKEYNPNGIPLACKGIARHHVNTPTCDGKYHVLTPGRSSWHDKKSDYGIRHIIEIVYTVIPNTP